jgi:hypothetical protein
LVATDRRNLDEDEEEARRATVPPMIAGEAGVMTTISLDAELHQPRLGWLEQSGADDAVADQKPTKRPGPKTRYPGKVPMPIALHLTPPLHDLLKRQPPG